MHIAFLTSEFPHKDLNSSAGLGTSIYNMALSLIEKDVQVTVFAYSQNLDLVFDFKGIKIHSIAHKKYHFFGWYFYRKYLNKYMLSVICKEKINTLEVPDWTGITAFMKFNIPIIMRIHGSDAYFCHLEGRPQKKKNFYFENKAIHNAEALISVSKYAAEVTREIFNLKKNIEIIPNGINLENFKNTTPLKYTQNTILYYGTLIRKKGVLELVSIFNKVIEVIPKATLILIGSDANDVLSGEKSTYKMMQGLLSEKAKEKIKYLGKIPYDSINKYIMDAHVCVFPSMAESFGMVTIEAMAMQKPVINSNYGWAEELIENNVDGILVNPKNHNKFAKAIITLLKDDEKSVKIAENAVFTVNKKFGMNKLAKQNIDFYQSVIND